MIRIISPCRDSNEESSIRAHVAEVVTVPHEHICNIGPLIGHNRNNGMGCDCDTLQWDTDIRATAEDVERIVSHSEITGGAYRHRRHNRLCACGFVTDENATEEDMLIPFGGHGVQRVASVGAGFLFIPKHALSKMSKPYFRYDIVGEVLLGEDVSFCMNAMQNGFSVYLDCDCIVEHCL